MRATCWSKPPLLCAGICLSGTSASWPEAGARRGSSGRDAAGSRLLARSGPKSPALRSPQPQRSSWWTGPGAAIQARAALLGSQASLPRPGRVRPRRRRQARASPPPPQRCPPARQDSPPADLSRRRSRSFWPEPSRDVQASPMERRRWEPAGAAGPPWAPPRRGGGMRAAMDGGTGSPAHGEGGGGGEARRRRCRQQPAEIYSAAPKSGRLPQLGARRVLKRASSEPASSRLPAWPGWTVRAEEAGRSQGIPSRAARAAAAAAAGGRGGGGGDTQASRCCGTSFDVIS